MASKGRRLFATSPGDYPDLQSHGREHTKNSRKVWKPFVPEGSINARSLQTGFSCDF
jgi:hypothetical protein